jgi:hypothetical protein
MSKIICPSRTIFLAQLAVFGDYPDQRVDKMNGNRKEKSLDKPYGAG